MSLIDIYKQLDNGVLFKIKIFGQTQKTLLILNKDNKLFLDLIQANNKCKCIHHIFIPHIQTLFLQGPEKLRIFLQNYKDNLTIIGEASWLSYFHLSLNIVLQHINELPWTRYSLANQAYFSFFDLKLWKQEWLINSIKLKQGLNQNQKQEKQLQLIEEKRIIEQYAKHNQLKLYLQKSLRKQFTIFIDLWLQNFIEQKAQELQISVVDIDLNMFFILIEKIYNLDLQELDIEKISQFFQQIKIGNPFDCTYSQFQKMTINIHDILAFFYLPIQTFLIKDEKKALDMLGKQIFHYHIKSSHNTYLSGHQFYGKSDILGYQLAIMQEYKCIEIDIWDGQDGQPIVTHGRTLCKEIQLKTILQFLQQNAFKYSSQPLILSLEIHCSEDQEKKICELLNFYFKENIISYTAISNQENLFLANLQNKILIKSKVLSDYHQKLEQNHQVQDSNSLYSQTVIRKIYLDKKDFILADQNNQQFSSLDCLSKNNNFIKQLMKTEIYQESFSQILENSLVRVYHSIKYFDSSNFKPLPFWQVGLQMVCLNIQTPDLHNLINQAFFQNKYLQQVGYKYRIKNQENLSVATCKFTIEILTLRLISKAINKNFSFVISMQLIQDNQLDQQQQQQELNLQSFYFTDNQSSQINKFEFETKNPKLSFAYFQIKQDNKLVAHSCILVENLWDGINVIDLFNKFNVSNSFNKIIFINRTIVN